MSTDFLDASERHWCDAELLRGHQRWPNASQLYGFAAECGLKAVMQSLGMTLRDDGAPQDRRHRVHIDLLWEEFVSFACGREAEELASRLGDNLFADWRVDQRYHATSSIGPDAADRHRQGASAVKQVVDRARLDGRIP